MCYTQWHKCGWLTGESKLASCPRFLWALVTNFCVTGCLSFAFSALSWRCWLGGRKGIQPVKNRVVGCWRGCLGWGADLHIAQQMPLPLTISCSSKSILVLTFLVYFYLSGTCSPGWSRTYSRRAVKWLCVCVCAWMPFLSAAMGVTLWNSSSSRNWLQERRLLSCQTDHTDATSRKIHITE